MNRGYEGGCDYFYLYTNEWLVTHRYEFGDSSQQFTFYTIEEAEYKKKEMEENEKKF